MSRPSDKWKNRLAFAHKVSKRFARALLAAGVPMPRTGCKVPFVCKEFYQRWQTENEWRGLQIETVAKMAAEAYFAEGAYLGRGWGQAPSLPEVRRTGAHSTF